MVEELYKGIIKPLEDFGYSADKSFIALREQVEQAEREMIPELCENEKRAYEQIKVATTQMQTMELQRMFEYSFRLGVRFATDIFRE